MKLKQTFWWLIASQLFPFICMFSCLINGEKLMEGYKTGLAINGILIEIYLLWQLAINLNELNK